MITPVILAGGTGTRLWPLSRESYPKQFANILGDQSFFQAALQRVTREGFANPLIVTHSDFRFIVAEQLGNKGIAPAGILLEPARRNTAAAILAAALYTAQSDPGALMLVCPADHLIADQTVFHDAVQTGIEAAQAGQIVTFGVTPDRPETGYGYLKPQNAGSVSRLCRFIEKPDKVSAHKLSSDGLHLWNAGIFLFQARTLIEAFHKVAPEYLTPVSTALDLAIVDLDFIRLAAPTWDSVPNISIDYAIMEKVDNISVVRLASKWHDLGGWDAVWRQELHLQPNARGCVTDAGSTALNCDNVLVRNETTESHVVAIGVRDLMVINTADAVLVVDQNATQQVGDAVKALRAKGLDQAHRFRRDHRPWGWFETLALSDRFQVKRIVVKPGAALSLQSHVHRSEHWVVVEGTAQVTVNSNTSLVTENQAVYIPLGARHRLENPGQLPMVLIEIQTGAYLGEDDIIRYQDQYARLPDQHAAE